MMNKKAISWIILIALSLVWGSSFILMKQGLRAFTSDEVAGLRITIASAFMLPFLISHYKLDVKKNLKGLLLMGVFGNLIPAFLYPFLLNNKFVSPAPSLVFAAVGVFAAAGIPFIIRKSTAPTQMRHRLVCDQR